MRCVLTERARRGWRKMKNSSPPLVRGSFAPCFFIRASVCLSARSYLLSLLASSPVSLSVGPPVQNFLHCPPVHTLLHSLLLHPCVCLSVRPFIPSFTPCFFTRASVCLSARTYFPSLLASLPVRLSLCPPVHTFLHSLLLYPCVCLSVCPPVHTFLHSLLLDPCVCLSVRPVIPSFTRYFFTRAFVCLSARSYLPSLPTSLRVRLSVRPFTPNPCVCLSALSYLPSFIAKSHHHTLPFHINFLSNVTFEDCVSSVVLQHISATG